jgi:hypothetical protein
MNCPYCGCDAENPGFEQGSCTCGCHWGVMLPRPPLVMLRSEKIVTCSDGRGGFCLGCGESPSD